VTYKAHLVVDNSKLLLRPGMTATATITVKDVKNALLVPNAALRFTPNNNASADNRSLLQRLMPRGPPRNRPSTRDAKGPNRTIWVLRNGEAVSVTVMAGVTDGKMTEVTSGDLKVGDRVIVDAVAAKR
jgi:HlyD family secretion protein